MPSNMADTTDKTSCLSNWILVNKLQMYTNISHINHKYMCATCLANLYPGPSAIGLPFQLFYLWVPRKFLNVTIK
jgi:hypothetical protein